MRHGRIPTVFSVTVLIWAAASALLAWLATVAGPFRTLSLSSPSAIFSSAATFAFTLGLPSCALVAAFAESRRGTPAATLLGAGSVATVLVVALTITPSVYTGGVSVHTAAFLAFSLTPILATICGVLLGRSSRRATTAGRDRAGLIIAVILGVLLLAGFVVPRLLLRSLPLEAIPLIPAALLLLVIAALFSSLVPERYQSWVGEELA